MKRVVDKTMLVKKRWENREGKKENWRIEKK